MRNGGIAPCNLISTIDGFQLQTQYTWFPRNGTRGQGTAGMDGSQSPCEGQIFHIHQVSPTKSCMHFCFLYVYYTIRPSNPVLKNYSVALNKYRRKSETPCAALSGYQFWESVSVIVRYKQSCDVDVSHFSAEPVRTQSVQCLSLRQVRKVNIFLHYESLISILQLEINEPFSLSVSLAHPHLPFRHHYFYTTWFPLHKLTGS